ncbi:unannotated protein [freshwater metagenome]|uniref:Unannotated protein n=1 Tax=freshwater metagenome TaxID=449393 RepID=A0A6J7GVQ3_9ZZZZ|nr:ABC transporter permease [Actinomycetota bacterium]
MTASENGFSGTVGLFRLAMRRDRILLPAWISVFALTAAVSAQATADLYPTLGSRIAAGNTINSSAPLIAIYGRVYDTSSLGAVSMIKMGGFGGVCVALLSIILMTRHTRAEEDSGRMELLSATAVGRLAPLGSASAVIVFANLVLALLTALLLVAVGLPASGSLAFGLSWAGAGLAFGAIAAVCAQLSSSARTATALASVVLAACYALRAVGDSVFGSDHGPGWPSWISPIGWAQQVRPFADAQWPVLLLSLCFSISIGAVALVLASRRDLGAGLFQTRSGPAGAAARLRSPMALAWRLQRGAFVGWLITFVLLGLMIGGIASSVGDFLNNPTAREFITKLGGEKGLVDAFLAIELSFGGILASAFGIQVVMRLAAEEREHRAEAVLATAVSRTRWALGHILIAAFGTAALLLAVGIAAGATSAIQSGEPNEVSRVALASLAQLPAAWVLTAITVAVLGIAPRLIVLGWVMFSGFILLAELGPLLNLPQWVLDVSPFAHVPRLPGVAATPTPFALLTAAAFAICAVGLASLNRRDIT